MGLDTFAIYFFTREQLVQHIGNTVAQTESFFANRDMLGVILFYLDEFDIWRDLVPKENQLFADVDLCRGLMSDAADACFRGKVYAGDLKEWTNVSLYQTFIGPRVVQKMHSELVRLPNHTIKDQAHLIRFFEICNDNGFGLYNWW